jgi:diguanylate cyclase (GGDEF)-like protein
MTAKPSDIADDLPGDPVAEASSAEPAALRERVAQLEQENERLRQVNNDLSERTLELYSLFELSYSLGAGIRYDRMPEDSMDFIGPLLGIEQFSLLLFNHEDGKLYIRAALGIPKEARKKCVITPPEGIAGRVFSHGEAVYVPDVTRDARYLYYKGFNLQGGSLLSLPLVDEGGQPFGVLNISKPEPRAFSESDISRYSTLAIQIAVIIQNYSSYRRLQELSLTDELTGVANRRAFFASLEEEHLRHVRSRKSYTLLLIDVDYFKRYNDLHGHLEGDRALQEVAAVLKARSRSADLLARYGGEEFVVCATRTGKAEGVKLAEALRAAIGSYAFRLSNGGLAAPLSITIGVATYPEDDALCREVLAKADRALYHGKTRGRNTVVSYPVPDEDAAPGVGATGDLPGRRGKGPADE